MGKLLNFFAFLVFLTGSWTGAFGLELRVAPLYHQGLVYASALDFGPSAEGLAVSLSDKATLLERDFSWEVGIEPAVAGLGTQVSFPVGGWLPLADFDKVAISGGLGLVPGFTLTRPRPLLLLGAEAGFRTSYRFDSFFSLEGGTGLRYTTCPEYSQKVAPYQLWDLTLSLGGCFRF